MERIVKSLRSLDSINHTSHLIYHTSIWSDIEVVITRLSRKQLVSENWPVGSNPTHSANKK